MKSVPIAAAAALSILQLAAAQPHRVHQHRHERREVVTHVHTVTGPPVQVILYQDENGNVFSSTTVTLGSHAPTPEPDANDAPQVNNNAVDYGYGAAAPSSSSSAQAPQVSSPPPYEPPAPAPTSSSAQAPPSSSSSAQSSPGPSPPATGGGSGNGITYTPYTDDGKCKSESQINSDFDQLKEFSIVRLYGTDCGQLDIVVNAAKQRGLKLFLGIPKEKANAGAVGGEVEKIAKALGGSWDIIHTIAVGNEHVNSGGSVGDTASAVKAAREALSQHGYGGPVVAPDTFVAILNNPDLCQHSDYMAANIHAFFDGKIPASGAGDFVVKQAQLVSEKCGGKKVMITETGWPNQGGVNGDAVPSKENQQAAISSIKQACSGGTQYILFSAFNEAWKQDTGSTFGCEKFWGILG